MRIEASYVAGGAADRNDTSHIPDSAVRMGPGNCGFNNGLASSRRNLRTERTIFVMDRFRKIHPSFGIVPNALKRGKIERRWVERALTEVSDGYSTS